MWFVKCQHALTPLKKSMSLETQDGTVGKDPLYGNLLGRHLSLPQLEAVDQNETPGRLTAVDV